MPGHSQAPSSTSSEQTTIDQDTPVDYSPSTNRRPPYSVYSKKEKWFIVALVSFAGLYSPFTANVYFPAIPTLATAFNKSTELINLTVTMYMVLQGLSPVVFGSLADFYGRRPVFVLCLMVLCLSCVGLALVPTNDFWLLMLLRCIQATGSASTIALGAGVIGDISEPAERGGFFGFYSLGPMFGPSVGPVIGGVLLDGLGWRSIFWFLCIASGVGCLVTILFLPETLRLMVGNGSITPPHPRVYRPVVPIIGRHSIHTMPLEGPTQSKTNFQNPLLLLKNLDILLLLVFNAIIYATFYSVTASISSLFSELYPFLNDTTIGLCFLAIGGGTGFGSLVGGKILDWDFQRVKKQYLRQSENFGEKTAAENQGELSETFPIEKARLRSMPYFILAFVGAGIGYGWCLERKVNIAAPLILQFIIGWTSMSVMNATQTLILDLAPGQGSSVTACNNVVRCELGALFVSVINLILKRMGAGWTYVLLNGICIISTPLLYLAVKLGPSCRAKRAARNRKKALGPPIDDIP